MQPDGSYFFPEPAGKTTTRTANECDAKTVALVHSATEETSDADFEITGASYGSKYDVKIVTHHDGNVKHRLRYPNIMHGRMREGFSDVPKLRNMHGDPDEADEFKPQKRIIDEADATLCINTRLVEDHDALKRFPDFADVVIKKEQLPAEITTTRRGTFRRPTVSADTKKTDSTAPGGTVRKIDEANPRGLVSKLLVEKDVDESVYTCRFLSDDGLKLGLKCLGNKVTEVGEVGLARELGVEHGDLILEWREVKSIANEGSFDYYAFVLASLEDLEHGEEHDFS